MGSLQLAGSLRAFRLGFLRPDSPKILRFKAGRWLHHCSALLPPTPSPGPALSAPLPNQQLPVTCNDIRGVVYLDQQVVACYW